MTAGGTDSSPLQDVALGVNLFGELSVSRSDKRIGEGVKILSWLRHTDTFAEHGLSNGNAFCGKVSVPPAQPNARLKPEKVTATKSGEKRGEKRGQATFS